MKQVDNQGARALEASADTPQTRTLVGPGQITDAARALARLRRRQNKRQWSGWLDRKKPSTRIWRGSRIVLPDGEVCYAYGAVRGKVVWSRHEHGLHGGFNGEPFEWGVLPAAVIRPWKNPNAVVLGRQKRGIREKPSLAKQAVARANGLKPTRPGRRRGRRPAQT